MPPGAEGDAGARETSADRAATWPWQEVLWRLAAPDGSDGYLNWVSGMIVLARGDYAEIQELADDEDPSLVGALLHREHLHELCHFYQVLMCGYLYMQVQILSSVVLPTVEQVLGVLRGGRFSMLVEAVDRVGEGASAEDLETILYVHEFLEERDDIGLGVPCLYEGQATFVEIVVGRPELGGPAFVEQLEASNPPKEYRLAFDVALDALGAHLAFRLFPLLTSLALCSSDPVMSFRLLLAECARIYPSFGADDELGSLDITELIDRCCGFADLGSPLAEDERDWGRTAYSEAVDTLGQSMREEALHWVDLFGRLPHYQPWLFTQVDPVVMLDPLPDGGIPFHGFRAQASRGWYFGLLAAVEHELHRVALSREGASAVAKHRDEARTAALSLVTRGNVDAYYNLGLDAARSGRAPEARAWWLLAAEQRDEAAIRCLALLERRSGRIEGSDFWLGARPARGGSALSTHGFLLALEEAGDRLRTTAPTAARACLRRSAQLGSRGAAVSYAIDVASTDPVNAALYLMAARRPIPTPVSEDDATGFRRATEELDRLHGTWGRRMFRRYTKEARRTFLTLDDTRELP